VIFDSKEVNKVKIPFQLINNLVFIPINVNGVELTFLLDSGVKETILFSLEENEISLKNIEKSLSGLGSEDAIEGLKSGEFTRERGWNLSITFYTLLLTRILIYPPTLVFPKWNNRFICI
jgi:hypothetical protein